MIQAHIEQLLAALKLADAGLIPIEFVNRKAFDKRGAYWSCPVFRVAGYRFEVFNDCGSWDYIDHIVTADGMKYGYDDLPGSLCNWQPQAYSTWGLEEWNR